MRKLDTYSTFFKDILFNKIGYFKCKKINLALLLAGILLNSVSFFLFTITGYSLLEDINEVLKFINIFLVIGVVTLKHRFKVNVFNMEKSISDMNYDKFYPSSIREVEVLPKNFVLYDDMSLNLLKKVYKEGAYVIIKTMKEEYTFYMIDDEVYLVNDEESLDRVKQLKLSREFV